MLKRPVQLALMALVQIQEHGRLARERVRQPLQEQPASQGRQGQPELARPAVLGQQKPQGQRQGQQQEPGLAQSLDLWAAPLAPGLVP